MDPPGSSPVAKGKVSTAVAAILLIIGLVTGLGLGYLVAPAPQRSPENVLDLPASAVQLSVSAGHLDGTFGFLIAGSHVDGAFWSPIGGMMSPTVRVRAGANVTVYFTNVDPDMPHSMGFVTQGPPYGTDPTEDLAFPGGGSREPHTGTMPNDVEIFAFTATSAGTYWYVCHVAGHAAAAMYGKFVVTP